MYTSVYFLSDYDWEADGEEICIRAESDYQKTLSNNNQEGSTVIDNMSVPDTPAGSSHEGKCYFY